VEGFVRTLRLITGLGLVASGTALAAPTALQAAAVWRAWQAVPAAEPGWMRGEPFEARPAWPAGGIMPELPATPAPLPVHVSPPPPPQMLPPPALELTTPAPGLPPHYRSALHAPPPPLLDGQAAPPLALGWTARQPIDRPLTPAHRGPPRIYIVRDGDDLTSIAARLYGHPAAAAAIWEANRGVLRDPRILPIGAALVLPAQVPSAAPGAAGQPVIEPSAAGHSPAAPPPTWRGGSWLTATGLSGLAPSPPSQRP